MTTATRPESAKGTAVRSTLEFVHAQLGDVELERALGLLPSDVRRRLEGAEPTEELPYADLAMLWEALDSVIGKAVPSWIERSGAYSIQSRGAQLYGGILKKSSPTEFLTQSVSLFKLFYHPGDMVVVEESSNRAVLRLIGFEPRTPLFCRRQTGGLTQALEIAGGGQPTTRHVRCTCEGDAYCEWEMTWQAGRDPEKRESPSKGLRLTG